MSDTAFGRQGFEQVLLLMELPLFVRMTARLAAPSATASRMVGTVVVRFSF